MEFRYPKTNKCTRKNRAWKTSLSLWNGTVLGDILHHVMRTSFLWSSHETQTIRGVVWKFYQKVGQAMDRGHCITSANNSVLRGNTSNSTHNLALFDLPEDANVTPLKNNMEHNGTQAWIKIWFKGFSFANSVIRLGLQPFIFDIL